MELHNLAKKLATPLSEIQRPHDLGVNSYSSATKNLGARSHPTERFRRVERQEYHDPSGFGG